jgi:hypothetical protein
MKAIGAFSREENDNVAKALYRHGIYENKAYYVSLFCIGRRVNPTLKKKYTDVPQITPNKILKFIYQRFRNYSQQKMSHPQWDQTGQSLWRAFQECENSNQFIRRLTL